jgi:HEAT repeat protein
MATPELRASTHAKLRDALPAYLAQLSNPDPQIRMMIAEQLSLYQWDTPTLEPLLRTTIESDPEGAVQATCVQTLATLWTATEDQEQTREFSEAQTAYLARLMRDSAHPLAAQFKAACVLVRNNPDIWLDEVVAFFKQVMGRSKAELKSLRPYWLGGIISDVVEALSTRPDQALEWVIAQAQHPDPAIREYIPFTLERLLAAGPFLERMIPTVAALLRDPSPDVRQTAVGFFYFKPHAHKVIDILRDLAANDPSLTVRVVARNTLDRIPPKSAQ